MSCEWAQWHISNNMVIVFGRNGAMSIFEKFSSKCPGKRQFAEIFVNEKLQQF